MARLLLVAIFLASPVFILPQTGSTETEPGSPSATEEELKRITQELLDAVAVGDKAVWSKYLSDTCLYPSEDGRVMKMIDRRDNNDIVWKKIK